MIYFAQILIIDDLPDQIALMGSMLQAEGYRVYAASDERSVCAFLEQRQPDLIVFDMQVDNAADLALCQKIRESEHGKDIPMIFVLSDTDECAVFKSFELGAADYLHKPFSRLEFLSRIKTQLRMTIQRRELLAANNELTQFTSRVTHDLRAPFDLINMLISELERNLKECYGETLPENIVALTDIIHMKTKQVNLMINRLFDFSKMCNVKPHATLIDTRAITEEIYADLMALEPPEREVSFTCEDLPQIVADEALFRMAIRNLLINALKYSSKKPKTVIRVYTVHDPSYYIIKVSDNGAGFDMAYVSKIFGVFERLHTEREFPGTGVGLALVNRIMLRHRGKIEAYGEVDKGATMTLFFPKNVRPIAEEQ